MQTAAEMAGIANYRTEDLALRVWEELYGSLVQAESEEVEWIGAADPMTGERSLPYGVYLLYDVRLRGVP